MCRCSANGGKATWAGALAMRTWVPEGGSRAYCVAPAAKWMAETCSPRKIGPRNKPYYLSAEAEVEIRTEATEKQPRVHLHQI